MKLNFILSNTTSGALMAAIEEICNIPTDQKVVVLVPENSSLMIEQLILNKKSATSNINVYSFVRLLEKIDNKNKDKYLSKENAVLIIRKIILDNLDKLVCFKKSAKKIGFAEIIYDTISQFKASRISVQEAQSLAASVPPALKIKMQDIAFIYSEYSKYIENKLLDNCDKLDFLSKAVLSSDYLTDAICYIVGFESLTAQAAEFIGEVAKASKAVKVACCYNNSKDAFIENNEVFEKVKIVANRYGLFYDPIVKNEQMPTFAKHIEQNVFAFPYKKMEIKDEVCLVEATEPRSEIEFIADSIADDVYNKRIKPSEVVIFCNKLEEYEHFLKTELGDRMLPFFIEKQHSLIAHPLYLLIAKCLDCVKNGYKREDIIELSKNILLGLGDDVDLFENYCNARAINYKGFFNSFNESNEEKCAKIENIRAKIIETLQIFAKNIENKHNIGDFCSGILNFLEEIYAYDRVDNLYATSLPLDKESAEVTLQSYSKLCNMLSGLITFMGDCKINIDEFTALFASGAEAIKISCLPLTLGSINITNDFLSISPNVKSVYICGAIDGVIPLRQDDCGIVVDSELGSLSDLAQKKIEPSIRTINKREKFKLYNLLMMAKHKLVVSYPSFNVKGEECKPSNIMVSLRRIFTKNGQELQFLNGFAYKNGTNCRFLTSKSAEKFLVENAIKEKENINYVDTDLLSTIYYALNGHLSSVANNILNNINLEPSVETLKKAKELFFGKGQVSISQLEKYFACPLLHFINYGLGAKEKEDGAIRALDVGNILHLIAERFVKNINKIDKNNISNKINHIIESSIESLKIPKENNSLVLSVVYGEAVRLCTYLYNELGTSDFKSVAQEYSFGKDTDTVVFKNGVKLVGKVDRIDVYDNYLKIIDYKTGNIAVDAKDIYYGRKIQLISYLLALKNFRNLKSAAVLYFPIHNEFADTKKNSENLYRNSGLILNDLNIVRAIDNTISLDNPKSHKIKVELKNNEETRKTGQFILKASDNLVSAETLDGLSCYVYKLINKAISEILEGNIICSPLKADNNKLTCDYCPMKRTCGVLNFDLKHGRSMEKKLTNEQVAEAKDD